jgi:hypothetical protein
MAVLYGLLAMHGLNASPPPEAHQHRSAPADGVHAHGSASAHGHGLPAPSGDRQHADDCECSGTGGHLAHADATCAAGGTSGAPAMDGPAASTATGPRAGTGFEGCWSRTGGERAPPSLHRLQLLRI